ncbi:S8 family serine peptidase [Streptomyces sp. NBC_00006]|uniref:S8 family peptidase n=1 Tax=unclassified Streptomyces TaxID=2593676 RepID=UPI00224E2361|nr:MULTISPECIES: S8 family serine peptidase [unclassified Streptomyces]MCX4829797.1 S8 family serine peptidase [Streptomyces sp. NBC_01016]MCX5530874.1 S8 family serine peptidase [Streptomyces sp. NBC_00006]
MPSRSSRTRLNTFLRTITVPLSAVIAFGALQQPAQAAPARWELPAMSVPQAQKAGKGSGITVAVLDTGIQTDHPALHGRVTEGPDILGGADKSSSSYGGHGTAMASNVLEVAPQAKVLGIRVLGDDNTGNEKVLTEGIRYAADHGADVISISLGMEGIGTSFDAQLDAAVQYALSKGISIVNGAGNAGDVSEETMDENDFAFPSGDPGVVTVAAADRRGQRASFSTVHNYVDIAAPGVSVTAAKAGTRTTERIDGTSPATALVSGVVALMREQHPKLAPYQITQALERTASTHQRGHNPQTGYGMVNAQAALAAAAKLSPAQKMAVGTAGAGKHFGPGDDGTPSRVGYGMDSETTIVSIAFAVVGLLICAGGFLLFRRGRRRRRDWEQQQRVGAPQPPSMAAY